MSYTKRQFVEAAFNEIGLAQYVFDLQPEQLESAVRALDAMMADWTARGIRLGYPLPTNPADTNLDDATSVPDYANHAIIANLAQRVAPAYGKTVSMDTRIAASAGFNTLQARTISFPASRFQQNTLAGAGNKSYRGRSIMLSTGDDETLQPPESNPEII